MLVHLARAFDRADVIRFASSRTVTVAVGEEKQYFVLHQYNLQQESQYFRTALSGAWQETCELREESPAIFTLFADWLYCKKLVFTTEFDTDDFLVQAYLLGNRLGAPNFNNAIIDALHARWNVFKWNEPSLITTVFEETTYSSKLRKLIADRWAWSARWGHWKATVESGEAIHHEFGTALCKVFLARMDEQYDVQLRTGRTVLTGDYKAPWLGDFCGTYHEHTTGTKCMRTPALPSALPPGLLPAPPSSLTLPKTGRTNDFDCFDCCGILVLMVLALGITFGLPIFLCWSAA